MSRTALIVEDDPAMGILMGMVFENEGFSIATAQTGAKALELFEAAPPAFVLLDLKLPDVYGMEVLEKMKRLEPQVPVLILTGHGEIETAVEAIKKGAYHYVIKPFQNADLLLLVRKALAESRREFELEALRERLSAVHGARYVMGKGRAMSGVLKAVERVAPTDMTVVLEGESGVGKEVMARVVHQKSLRRAMPFVAVDCGTLPEGLVESELFGYERGAFTGAEKRKLGQFEIAHGGTLFLDEVGNLGLPVQAKLLRVLQERCVQHLGGRRQIPVDVRILAASNRSLPEEVRAGRFREDLYHRLNEFSVRIPALRERLEDIPELVELFLDDARRTLRKEVSGLTEASMQLLRGHDWPGNIRQLKNTIRAGALMAEDVVEPQHLAPFLARDRAALPESPVSAAIFAEGGPSPLKRAAMDAEKWLIQDTLKRTGHNKAETARLLHVDRSVLYDKIKKLGIK